MRNDGLNIFNEEGEQTEQLFEKADCFNSFRRYENF